MVLSAGVVRKDDGDFQGFRLPPMLIFRNLKHAPKGVFPPEFVVCGTKSGSMTADLMVNQYIPKILARRPGCFFKRISILLIMDSETCHKTDDVIELLNKENVDLKLVRPGMTPLLQLLDTHVNKSFKGNLRDAWDTWIDEGETTYTKTGKGKRPSYAEIAKWVEQSWKKAASTDLIVKGFFGKWVYRV